MRVLAAILGVFLLFVVLLDAFQTMILPRRAIGRFRITRLFYLVTWRPWVFFARLFRERRARESAFSYYGPLSLILLLIVWATGLVFGFSLLYFALGSRLNDTANGPAHFTSDLYVSGTTIFTLGLGDVRPLNAGTRVLIILEAGMGIGFLAMVMGYFPVLYTAFSKREASISLLDARAGTPPTASELLRRHAYEGAEYALETLLLEWEHWSAELLESHISYPLLCYFRSQHNNQSWIGALTSILDASALLVAGVQGLEARQAQLTFAMARHAIVDLSQNFLLQPVTPVPDRLPPASYYQLHNLLCESHVRVCDDANTIERLNELRRMYEGYAQALSDYLCMALPPWIAEPTFNDNWLRVSKIRAEVDSQLPPAPRVPDAWETTGSTGSPEEHHHDF
jgi:hypothetical protein